MPSYLVQHAGQRRDDILIQGDDLLLHFPGGWAVFSDRTGICLALPPSKDLTIQRVDEHPEEEPAWPAEAEVADATPPHSSGTGPPAPARPRSGGAPQATGPDATGN